MMDWTNSKPNARYWVLKLIKDNFHSGDKLVDTKLEASGDVVAQAFVTPQGKKLLIANKRNRAIDVALPAGTQNVTIATVDEASGDGEARVEQLNGSTLKLTPFAVNVVSLP